MADSRLRLYRPKKLDKDFVMRAITKEVDAFYDPISAVEKSKMKSLEQQLGLDFEQLGMIVLDGPIASGKTTLFHALWAVLMRVKCDQYCSFHPELVPDELHDVYSCEHEGEILSRKLYANEERFFRCHRDQTHVAQREADRGKVVILERDVFSVRLFCEAMFKSRLMEEREYQRLRNMYFENMGEWRYAVVLRYVLQMNYYPVEEYENRLLTQESEVKPVEFYGKYPHYFYEVIQQYQKESPKLPSTVMEYNETALDFESNLHNLLNVVKIMLRTRNCWGTVEYTDHVRFEERYKKSYLASYMMPPPAVSPMSRGEVEVYTDPEQSSAEEELDRRMEQRDRDVLDSRTSVLVKTESVSFSETKF